MSLIKKIDVKNYLSTRYNQPFREGDIAAPHNRE
jgi:hypothetical protein